MKAVIASLVLVLAALCSPVAKAWNCPAGQIRQQAPAGTPTTTPYYDVVEGIAFICVPATPPTNPTGGNSNATSQSSSSSAAASNSASQSSATGGKSSSVSGSTATGGTSNATGGTATGGNATSGVSNAGNSYSTNNNQASGGAGGTGGQGGAGGSASSNATGGNQKQSQSQSLANSGNSTAMASGNGVGNGNNSNDSTSITNVAAPRIPVNTAVAPPVIPTSPCFKGVGVGVQTMAFGGSFGGGKVDPNCAILETSRLAPNRLVRCKVYITDKYAKAAGVTLDDCMLLDEPPVAPVVEAPVVAPAPAPQPIVVNVQPVVVPAPVVNVIAPAPAPSIVVHATPAKPRVPRSNAKCVPRECPKAKPTVWENDSVEALPIRNKS